MHPTADDDVTHTAAEHGAALAVLRERADVDLLSTDVVVPGINGRQLADAALARKVRAVLAGPKA